MRRVGSAIPTRPARSQTAWVQLKLEFGFWVLNWVFAEPKFQFQLDDEDEEEEEEDDDDDDDDDDGGEKSRLDSARRLKEECDKELAVKKENPNWTSRDWVFAEPRFQFQLDEEEEDNDDGGGEK